MEINMKRLAYEMMSLLGIAGIEYSDVVSDLKNYPDKIGVTFTYKQYSNETNQMNLNDNLGLPYTNPIQYGDTDKYIILFPIKAVYKKCSIYMK